MAEIKNYHREGLGNEHGEIQFGHIHASKKEGGAQKLAGVLIRTGDDGGRHYMRMDSSGDPTVGTKGATQNWCPGTYIINCGKDVVEKVPAFDLLAQHGDINIAAPHGTITLSAKNIKILGEGPDGKEGVIEINANEKILIDSKGSVDIKSVQSTKVFSENTVDMIGKSLLNIYGGLASMADGATKLKGSKVPSIMEEIMKDEKIFDGLAEKMPGMMEKAQGMVGQAEGMMEQFEGKSEEMSSKLKGIFDKI